MKAFQDPQAGDLFYIPGRNAEELHGFVIARYIQLIPHNVGHLVEVFDRFYTDPPTRIEDVDRTRRLFRPVMWDKYFFKPWPRWKILFSDPGYVKSQSDYENIGIAFDSRRAWIGGQALKVSQEIFDSLEPSICWSTDHLIFRVNAHLAGIFGPDEQYDYHRLPERFREGNASAREDVLALALEMDQRFQVWQAEEKKRKPRSARKA